jgi:NADPH:quinone reductase
MPRVVTFDEPGPPEVLQILDEAIPEPAGGEVRIKLEAIGINRLDQMVRAGNPPRPVRSPHTRLGIEGTGIVDAVGVGVEGFAIGDPVIIAAVPDMDVNGTYADFTLVPASRLIARPDGLDAVHAAAIWVAYSTAYGALIERAAMRPADRVLITAASSAVGLAAIQVANQIGALPLAVTRHTSKRQALLSAGAASVIATDEEDLLEAVQQQASGLGVDIIIDSVMGPDLADLARAAKPGGTLVTVGWLDPRPASFPMNAPLTIYRYMSFEHTLDPNAVRRIAAFLTAGLRTGVLSPTIDRVFTLDEIVDAHHYLEQNSHIGKLVVTV